MVADELEIEKPELNLDVSTEKKSLPDEIPPVLDKLVHENTPKDSLEMDALIEDVEIYLEIGDLKRAHDAYKRLHRVYANLDDDSQRKYFSKVEELFKDIRDYNSFGAKLRRAFGKNKYATLAAKKSKQAKNKKKKEQQIEAEKKKLGTLSNKEQESKLEETPPPAPKQTASLDSADEVPPPPAA